jgi:hypothetical protein
LYARKLLNTLQHVEVQTNIVLPAKNAPYELLPLYLLRDTTNIVANITI